MSDRRSWWRRALLAGPPGAPDPGPPPAPTRHCGDCDVTWVGADCCWYCHKEPPA